MQCNMCDEEKRSIMCVCPECWDKYKAAFDEMLAALSMVVRLRMKPHIRRQCRVAVVHAEAVLTKKGGTT